MTELIDKLKSVLPSKKENEVVADNTDEEKVSFIDKLKSAIPKSDNKEKESQSEIRKKNEEKYIKNGENYYPFAKASQSVWKVTKRYMMIGFSGVGLYYLLYVFAHQLYPAFANIWGYLKASWITTRITLGGDNADLGFLFSNERIQQDAQGSIVAFQQAMVNFDNLALMKIVGIGLVFFMIIHLFFVTLRKRHGEIKPIKNDALGRRIKQRTLQALDMDYTAIDTIFPEQDIDGKNIKRWRNRQEKKADQAIRAMDVSVHSRRDVNGDHIHQRAVVRIKQPVDIEVRKQVLNKLDDAQGIFGASSGGVLKFGEQESGADRKFFTWRAERDITKEVQSKIDKGWLSGSSSKGKSVEKEESQWAYPLDLLIDQTGKIDEATLNARKYAEERSIDIDSYLASNDYPATQTGIDVGNSSVAYNYKMETTQYNVTTIEEQLVRQLNLPNVQITTYAGTIIINLPLPDDMKIPMDTRTLFEEVF